MTPDELAEKINQPKRVEIDGQKVEQHDLSEIVKFDKYIEAKKAIKKRGFCLKFSKLKASGA